MNFYWKDQPVIKSADLSNLTRIRLTTSYSDCLWSEEEDFKKLWLSPHRAEAGFCAAGTYSTTAARAPPDAGSFIARRKKKATRFSLHLPLRLPNESNFQFKMNFPRMRH